MLPKSHQELLFHSRMIRPVVGGGGRTRGQTGVSQRVHVGFLRSRPPDTPHRTAGTASPGSAGVPPAPSLAQPRPSPPLGSTGNGARALLRPGRCGSRPQGGCLQHRTGAQRQPKGQDAGGTPALPGSHHPMTSSHQGHHIAAAFWCRLWLKQVHLSSGLFVFIRVHSWFVFINDRLFFLE